MKMGSIGRYKVEFKALASAVGFHQADELY